MRKRNARGVATWRVWGKRGARSDETTKLQHQDALLRRAGFCDWHVPNLRQRAGTHESERRAKCVRISWPARCARMKLTVGGRFGAHRTMISAGQLPGHTVVFPPPRMIRHLDGTRDSDECSMPKFKCVHAACMPGTLLFVCEWKS